VLLLLIILSIIASYCKRKYIFASVFLRNEKAKLNINTIPYFQVYLKGMRMVNGLGLGMTVLFE